MILTLEEKLTILSDAAKYDAACTSSGVNRKGESGKLGNTRACGICHSFAADGRCISLLKILYTNECVFDCKYCINRVSNDIPRAAFTPEEIARLTVEFYRRNYIEGLFLSSGVLKSPVYTMEQIYQAIWLIRNRYHFNGYIHVKIVPGTPQELITQLGYLVDRVSVNMELPTGSSLKKLCPHKSASSILKPMRSIQEQIHTDRMNRGSSYERLSGSSRPGLPDAVRENSGTGDWYESHAGNTVCNPDSQTEKDMMLSGADTDLICRSSGFQEPAPAHRKDQALTVSSANPAFVPAGQSTQMIIGATPETDYQILTAAESMYDQYDMKRVFYSAYVGVNEDSSLPAPGQKPPLLREHRLYQADWLLRFYGFRSGELLSAEKPNFNIFLDPKCDWALRHLELFPVDVTMADYYTLLRVPGIGVKSAKRILAARRDCTLDFLSLKRMGVVLKRAHYFITCGGKMMYPVRMDQDSITRSLICNEHEKNWEIAQDMNYQQLSLFQDCNLEVRT
ncbi:MAG: putative DNA modification/repair radical SAM protein [Lachnospiraceae bacterium]